MPNWPSNSDQPRQEQYGRTTRRGRRLRREPTPTEAQLWKTLRLLNRDGANFRRQPAIGPWVFDFGDFTACVLIEIDVAERDAFADVAERDAQKSAWAEANGFRLLRFKNDEVWGDLDRVVEAIRSSIAAPHPLPPPHQGEGNP